jgi:hypothetical protein
MRPSEAVMRSLAAAGAAYRSAESAKAGAKGQYIFKYDDADYRYKVVADVTSSKATVTVTEVIGTDPPVSSTFEVKYEKEAKVYPDFVGCPYDCYIFTFDDFSCANAREFKMFFSKSAEDLYGDGTKAYFMGTAMPNLDVLGLLYPCEKK